MPTIREPDDNINYESWQAPKNEKSQVQGLVGSLIENSEELARVLQDIEYEAQMPVNRGFEHFLQLFIVQLKKFQNEL